MKFLVAPLAVVVAGLAAVSLGADPVVSALLLLLAVVVSALFGRTPGVVASILGALALNLGVLDATNDRTVSYDDDALSLVVFLGIALLVGTLVARNRVARHQAALGEAEARLRSETANRLLRGEPTAQVVQFTADAIVEIFELASCTIATAGATAASDSARRPGRTVSVRTDEAAVDAIAAADRPLTPAAENTLTTVVSALGVVFARAELERAANEARIDAEVNRARAAFFAAAGHNLRTPLASVSASVSALLDSGDLLTPTEQRQLLETIRDETSRLARMVSKVLSQSLIRGSDLDPEREPVDLGGMAQVAVGRLGPAAENHHIELDIPPELGPLWLDITMLEQILLNLLENAVRFAPRGTTITVAARRLADVVDLRVIDHGPGVDETERDLVFNEFHRSSARTEGEGTGLGLAIVRALTGAHGGTTWCEPTPGGGATFVVHFPLATAETMAISEAVLTAAPLVGPPAVLPSPENPGSSDRREDEPSMLEEL